MCILSEYFLTVTIAPVRRGKGVPVKLPLLYRRLALTIAGLACLAICAASPVAAQETGDSQIFLAGFNAYQQKEYATAITRLGEVLQKHPDTPLRDMTLFWLARAHYKAGNRQDAAHYMAQFTREYPDNPLKNTVEEELLTAAANYEKSGQAAVRIEEERKAAAQKLAREKAESERLAKLKAEEERKAAELAAARKLEAERLATAKAESERLAKLKAEEERKAAELAAARKLEAERLAAAKAEDERLAKLKAEEERKAAELAAARKQEAERERKQLREKAIAEYKGILERFPGTPAAQTAALRLKELGVAVAAPAVLPAPVAAAPNAQVLVLEVAQYAAFEFVAASPAAPVEVARVTKVPFELVNRGNGPDSFYLASGFPAEFGVRFAAGAAPEQYINQTPVLQPGERFSGLMQVQAPATTIDGLRITHPIKAASSFNGEVSQSREITLAASAPLLRAVLKVDNQQPAPGERVQYRITVLNVGSVAADEVTLRLNYPAQYEPSTTGESGLRREMQAALVQDGIALKSGESRDFVVSFQVRGDALAREELLVRADLINPRLQSRSSFHAAAVSVQPVSAVAVKLAAQRVVAIPGQVVTIPVTVLNSGNQRERFSLSTGMPAAQKVAMYHDLNRDGQRQANEPELTVIGPLGPREEAVLLLEVATQQNAPDGSGAGITVNVVPESGQGKPVVAEARLDFSRPVVQLSLKGRAGLLVPGELLTVDLVVHNQGSNLAKGVELQALWPEQLELMAAVPAAEKAGNGSGWRLGELGAGEKRIVKASFRVRTGTGVGTGIQLKSVLSYTDQLGNRY